MNIIFIFFFTFISALFSGLYSQHLQAGKSPGSIIHLPFNLPSEKAGNSFYIEYDLSDEALFMPTPYQRILVPINQRYNNQNQDSLITHAIVRFDSLVDISNTHYFPWNGLANATIDSFQVTIGHENNSGLNDTLAWAFLALDTNGYPTQQVLMTDTIILTAGLSPGNQFNSVIPLTIPVYFPTDTSLKLAIKITYSGAIEDTFAIVAGFGVTSLCGNIEKAEKSHFYPNSLAYWTGFNLQLPTAAGGDIYYDCNGNIIFDEGIDGHNLIQNWKIGLWLSAPDLGYHKPSMEQMAAYPNPAITQMYIRTMEAGSAKIKDLNGRTLEIFPLQEGVNSIYTGNFAAGLYILEMVSGGQTFIQKIYVQD